MLSPKVRHLVPVQCWQCKTLIAKNQMHQLAASPEPAGRDVASGAPSVTRAARMGPWTAPIQHWFASWKPSDAAAARVRGWIDKATHCCCCCCCGRWRARQGQPAAAGGRLRAQGRPKASSKFPDRGEWHTGLSAGVWRAEGGPSRMRAAKSALHTAMPRLTCVAICHLRASGL